MQPFDRQTKSDCLRLIHTIPPYRNYALLLFLRFNTETDVGFDVETTLIRAIQRWYGGLALMNQNTPNVHDQPHDVILHSTQYW